MKKIAILLLLGAVAWTAGAQKDTRAEVMADIEKAGGGYYMYPTDQPMPTAAPKGYKPPKPNALVKSMGMLNKKFDM